MRTNTLERSQGKGGMASPFHLIAGFLGVVPALPKEPRSRQARAETESRLAAPRTLAIIFSKARPRQCLRAVQSLLRMTTGISHVAVLYLSDGASYDTEFASKAEIEWIAQNNFHEQVKQLVSRPEFTHILFQVDDAVHVAHWNVTEAALLLRDRTNVLAVHAKLWPGALVCRSTVRDTVMKVPPLTQAPPSHVIFSRDQGSMDWNYPMDLSGALYRRLDLQTLFSIASPSSNPNTLEISLSQSAQATLAVLCPLSACPCQRVMCVVSVNTVQTNFASRVLGNLVRDEDAGYVPGESFGVPLDDSVHVGLPSPKRSPSTLLLSVLLPFQNAEATLERAVRSVLQSAITSMEVVLVDDASEDASWFLAQKLARYDARVRVLPRARSSCVAAALNFGLKACNGRFIARMDADDEALPGRLEHQVSYLLGNPHVGVLGTSALLIGGEEPDEQRRRAPTPKGSATLHWSLYFFCPLVHPSITCRREVFDDVGGYPENIQAEDLGFYLALVERGHWLIENLAEAKPLMRVYRGGLTSKWTEESRLRIAQLSLNAAKRVCAYDDGSLWTGISAADWRGVQTNQVQGFSPSTKAKLVRCLNALSERVLSLNPKLANTEDGKFVLMDCMKRQGILLQ